jgi:hypothetical protein
MKYVLLFNVSHNFVLFHEIWLVYEDGKEKGVTAVSNIAMRPEFSPDHSAINLQSRIVMMQFRLRERTIKRLELSFSGHSVKKINTF